MGFHPHLWSPIIMVSLKVVFMENGDHRFTNHCNDHRRLYCENMLICLWAKTTWTQPDILRVRLTTQICIYIQLMTGLKGILPLTFRLEKPLWDTRPHLHLYIYPLLVQVLRIVFFCSSLYLLFSVLLVFTLSLFPVGKLGSFFFNKYACLG